jgi:small redox-active disulfide protein 2
MDIKILGSGCANCKTMYSGVEEALRDLSIGATLEKVEDIQRIISFGVMATPGLVIDGKVISHGRVQTVSKLKEIILESKNAQPA